MQSAGPKSRAPAHQNSYAFIHNKNSKKTKAILAIPNVGLCRRCHDKIEWRRKYRKYRPIDQPKKCADCHEKKVKAAYHVVCSDCARTRNACPKCLESKDIVGAIEPADAETRKQIELLQSHKGALPGLTERERRGLLRQLMREAGEAAGVGGGAAADSDDEESVDAGAAGGGGAGGDDSDDEFIAAMLVGATERARAALQGVSRPAAGAGDTTALPAAATAVAAPSDAPVGLPAAGEAEAAASSVTTEAPPTSAGAALATAEDSDGASDCGSDSDASGK